MTRRRFTRAALFLFIASIISVEAAMDDCYEDDMSPQRCLPPFENAAYGRTVEASNTCGTPAEEYCLQTGVTGVTKSCHTCDSINPRRRHGVEYLTDLNDDDKSTWWQSSTMLSDVQYPTMVNLTLNLTKAYDITYVRLKFHTSRPESFAIYKKKCHTCSWQPLQFYSGSCFSTFGLDNKGIVTGDDEQKALCTDDFSDISPLTGGNVAFSTLEGRPSAYNFDKSTVLQDWVKAVAIKITLNRINTFGDEVFKDPKVLKSYYYAVSDLSVGGRCSCNGHASKCYVTHNHALVCRCQHNTTGADCERCADLFNDRPWRRATRNDPGECIECDCNGMADSCYFDAQLYRDTGHGGHCVGCRNNTDGPNCERCLPFHYRDPVTNRCVACHCNDIGSRSQQCAADGQCPCKGGVGGAMCDQCMNGFYHLSEAGCTMCQCSVAGSVEGTVCNSETGQCVCKLNVEGLNCEQCKLGTMNLQESNPYGCTSCFCHGHSNVCEPSEAYTVAYILSEFETDDEGWKGFDYRDRPSQVFHNGDEISMLSNSYFSAPEKFLGVQRFSYNQLLTFELRVSDEDTVSDGSGSLIDVFASRVELILEGEGYRVVASIDDHNNRLTTLGTGIYEFRLHEAAGFEPKLTPFEFQKLLNNLTSIRIRSSSYGRELYDLLDNVQLTTAELGGAGPKADWVEVCNADNYVGNFTESCSPGYTRDPPNGGKYAPCVPCNCNGHAVSCDPETGVCDCDFNTVGDHCEICEDGFYGEESLRGTPQECRPCPCPQGSACAVLDDGDIVCTSCPLGTAGRHCELCMDGWFGQPTGRGPCQRCMCNGNIDGNAIGNCNRETGECLKCVYNTTGFYCDACLLGYFGKAVTNNPAERCQLCQCNFLGSENVALCDETTGQCECKQNVEGRSCDRCRIGFWNLFSDNGCEACNCHQMGASTGQCDQNTGQCDCLPGVGEQRCDHCLANHFGLNRTGCQACDCNPDGSETLQCNENGRCVCKEGVLGPKCDQCQENYFDLSAGCVECPPCYGLVQDAVNKQREELRNLINITTNIGSQSTAGNDNDFEEELKQLNVSVQELLKTANENNVKADELNAKIEEVSDQLQQLYMQLSGVENNVDSCTVTVQEADKVNKENTNTTKQIRKQLTDAQNKLNQAQDALVAAKAFADTSEVKEQNMTKLANFATDLATEHEKAAVEITSTAQTALDTSRRAEQAIQDAIDVLENLMNTLDELADSDNKLPAAKLLRDDLLNQSSVVKASAESAKNEATDLFTDAGKLVVGDIDTDQMESAAALIQTQSEALMPQIDSLETLFNDNWQALESERLGVQKLLELADATQNTIDMLLAQAHSALKTAEDAVQEGNATYESLVNTKKSLESFDEEINTNRKQAETALAKTDIIQENIDTANNKTAAAKGALGQASAIAAQASDKAHQALAIAGNIKRNTQTILTNAAVSETKAEKINNEVALLDQRIADTESLLSDVEDKAGSEKNDVAAATAAASDARAKASDSSKRVEATLNNLEKLLNQLSSLKDVSDEDINAADVEIATLQAQVDALNLPTLIDALNKKDTVYTQTLQKYDENIQSLKNDIANLQDITNAIPTKCANVDSVEQP